MSPRSSQEDLLMRPVDGYVLVVFKTVLSPYELEYDQPSARTGYLSNRRPPEVLV